MGALTSLNLANNSLGNIVLPEGWTKQVNSEQTAYEYKHIDGTVQGDNPGKPEGVIALANAIPDMGALSKFDISNCNLTAEGGKALAAGLQGNQVMTELSVANNRLSQRLSGRRYFNDMSGVIALADVISDMGALSIANVMGNSIGKEMLSKLQESMRSKPNLISLCGIADDVTEAGLSGLAIDADDAIILASELPDKRALIKLDISNNRIGAEQERNLQRICVAGDIELVK
jgi:hypothetical protein